MFSHAAFSVVTERAAAPVRNPPIDLDLAGPSRPCPVVVDEEPEYPSAPLPDLAASSAPLARDVLPPALALSWSKKPSAAKLYTRSGRPLR